MADRQEPSSSKSLAEKIDAHYLLGVAVSVCLGLWSLYNGVSSRWSDDTIAVQRAINAALDVRVSNLEKEVAARGSRIDRNERDIQRAHDELREIQARLGGHDERSRDHRRR